MFPDLIPISLHSEYATARSYGGVYSLAFNAHEMEPHLHHSPTTHRFYFGVQCGPYAVRFKAIAHF
eukprot:6693870-Prymnesium_polylepis.1